MINPIHNKLYSKTNEELQFHPISNWLNSKNWNWYDHQLETLKHINTGSDVIVFSPTGTGKTLCGFLPSFVDLHKKNYISGLHTLYISPLKALTYDIHRNISLPINDLNLPIRFETRTGDTSNYRKLSQIKTPPHFLMTTPESLALLVSYKDSKIYFKNLQFLIIDELHTFFENKRGDLLSLLIEKMQSFSPFISRIGLSATIQNKEKATKWLCRKNPKIITPVTKIKPKIKIIKLTKRVPWSGHSAKYAVNEIYNQITNARKCLIFVNTRSQSEFLFQELWKINTNNLKIAIHHGSLERGMRKKVEDKMASGNLDAIVSTSSLELGVDWANIDLVFQVGGPKGINRLLQRIGRSNHQIGRPSKAILVPTNRFEYIECLSAIDEINKNNLDKINFKEGSYDVLAQHILCLACSDIINVNNLFKEIKKSFPYKSLDYKNYIRIVEFVKNGGYSLKNYSEYNKLIELEKGTLKLKDDKFKRNYRMNVGTIVEAPMLRIKISKKNLGQIEEKFILNLSFGDRFIFGGQILKFLNIKDSIVNVTKSKSNVASVPSYVGGKLQLSSNLANSVRELISNRKKWTYFPKQIQEWLKLQSAYSKIPKPNEILIEVFPFKCKFFTIIYSFEGKNANETLGFLLTKRFSKLNLNPISFSANDYSLAIESLNEPIEINKLFDNDLIKNELKNWLSETPLLKRIFRDNAIISGLVHRHYPGKTKSGKQILFSTDLMYDVLLKYEPNHILLESIYKEALNSLVDIRKIKKIIKKIKKNLQYINVKSISPLAVPLILQINKENILKENLSDKLIEDLEKEILKEANVLSIN